MEGGEGQSKSRNTLFDHQNAFHPSLVHLGRDHSMEGNIGPNWQQISVPDRGLIEPDVNLGTGSPIV